LQNMYGKINGKIICEKDRAMGKYVGSKWHNWNMRKSSAFNGKHVKIYILLAGKSTLWKCFFPGKNG
jgi:hypothetical protein